MKIAGIKIDQSEVFGGLKLDFRLENGEIADTVVIAGENGTGKTKLLEMIYAGPSAEETENGKVFFICEREKDEKEGYRALYSTVEINYDPTATRVVTDNVLDGSGEISVRSGDDLATKIQQLIIDMDSSDASELQAWIQANEGQVPPKSVRGRRVEQFRQAFAVMFGKELTFDGVETINGERKVFFRKDGERIELADLSSGEKQIVFRGAFLLQNRQNMRGRPVLIDEPELSLHPSWRTKILNYYQQLFREGKKSQTSQLFVTTHSPRVVASCFADEKALLIVLRREGKRVTAHKITGGRALPTLTIAETNYLAFNLISVDYHVSLYSYLVAKFNFASVIQADKFIAKNKHYNPKKHERRDKFRDITYKTLPTYIRNTINHPDSERSYSEEELAESIKLLIEVCKSEPRKKEEAVN